MELLTLLLDDGTDIADHCILLTKILYVLSLWGVLGVARFKSYFLLRAWFIANIWWVHDVY
jgi:hypothetical protein